MIEVIQSLAQLPGVLLAALVTDDGVPVAVPGRTPAAGESSAPWSDPDVLAAISAAWMDDLSRALGKLSWETPRRAALRAARGTLLVLPASGALLVVVLERGIQPDGLWLSMDGAAARIERLLRALGDRCGAAAPQGGRTAAVEPPAPLPRGAALAASERTAERTVQRRVEPVGDSTTDDRERPVDR